MRWCLFFLSACTIAQERPAASPIAWRWDGDEPGFGTSFYKAPRIVREGAIECRFTYDHDADIATTGCNGWSHDESHAFVEDAALLLDSGTLYSARISNIASGCVVHAFDVRTGKEKWSSRLEGMGPIDHSEYLNAIEFRMVGGRPAVFGWESAGRYVEALDPATGATAYHAIVKTN